MDKELKDKTLKLLADPHKLKSQRKNYASIDRLKQELESKFNYQINNRLYQYILTTVKTELIIDSVLQDIINRVILDHSP